MRTHAFRRETLRKVIVIGPGGAGKSTLARRIAERTRLPLIHLDTLFWRPGWHATPPEEWDAIVQRLVKRDAWILDGNYGRTLDIRMRACDTVVFLDTPRRVCLGRILRRRVRYIGRQRPDLAAGCPERITWEFVRWIWTYADRRRPGVLALLDALRPDQRAIRLRDRRDVERFLRTLPDPDRNGP